jgi:putative DNA primase/helicase
MAKETQEQYLEVERKVINLMLRFPEVVQELKETGINPEFFHLDHKPLVQAIFYAGGLSQFKRTLTDDHYRTLLIEQGVKGDITIAMQVYHSCLFGVPHSNTKEDLDLLVNDLKEAYTHREGVEALHRMNENVQKLGYAGATKKYANELNEIVQSTSTKEIEWTSAEDYYCSDYFVDWLWKGRIANSEINLIVGKPGQGKSLITLDIAARLSNGSQLPFSGEKGNPTRSAIFCPEDNMKLVASRLTVAGANRKNIGLFPTAECSAKVVESMVVNNDVRLFIFDPITQFTGQTNNNRETEVRDFMTPLKAIAEKHNVAIWCVMHLNKEFKNRTMLDRILGSVAWGALPRVVIGSKSQAEGIVLVSAKNNLGEHVQGMPYQIQKVFHGKGDFGKVDWGNTLVEAEATIDDGTGSSGSAIQEAKDFLQDKLSEGTVPAKAIFQMAENEGIAARTLRRASQVLNIRKAKGTGQNASFFWSLPNTNGKA